MQPSQPPAEDDEFTSGRLYDRGFLFAFISQTCFTLAVNLMNHYARWITQLGGDVTSVGWIMGVGSIASVVLRPWLGELINRFGARSTWLLGYAIFGVGSLGNLFLHDLGVGIFLVRGALVLGPAFAFASSMTYISQSAPRSRRTEAIGILGGGGFIGMLVGPYLGVVILGSGDRTREDFELLFIVAAVALLLPAILVASLRTTPHGRDQAANVGLREFFANVRRYWPGAIIAINVVFGVCMTVPSVWVAKYVDDVGLSAHPTSPIAVYFLGYGLWGLIVRVASRRVPDRRGRRKVLIAGMLFMGLGMFSFLLVPVDSPRLMIIPGIICGTGHALSFHTIASLCLDRFPSDVRGTGSTLALMSIDIGLFAGAPALSYVVTWFGWNGLYVVIGTLCIAAAILFTWVSLPIWRQRRADARAP